MATDPTTATSSTPWFTTAPGTSASGISITPQRTALNEQTTGIANDLSSQSTSLLSSLASIVTNLNAKPAA
jgi:hypothetical protein